MVTFLMIQRWDTYTAHTKLNINTLSMNEVATDICMARVVRKVDNAVHRILIENFG